MVVVISKVQSFTHIVIDDPLVGSIAQEYLTDRETHDRHAREWTKR